MEPRIRSVRGFTLIELLVVIAIIGVLSSVVLASLNGARAKARDARRLSDIKQIQTALELWYDSNGSYPPYTENECGGTEGYTTSNNNFMAQLVAAKYLPSYPTDPGNIMCNIQYTPVKAGQGYVVFAKFESRSKNGLCDPSNDAGGWSCFAVNYYP